MKYQFIKNNRSTFDVGKMCHVLSVSKSGYYAWKKRKPSLRRQQDDQLKEEIRQIHTQSRKKYGSPKITEKLRQKGNRLSGKRVVRLMKELGIKSHRKRSKVRTTQSGHGYPVADNLLNRNFQADKPNQIWVSDITYCATAEGWLYLCAILDLYSRKVVGWNMRSDLKSELVLGAFEMACINRQPATRMIFHSDRGVQYACHAFVQALKDKGFVQSMSRKGNCWDNAVAEAFFAQLKQEGCDRIFASRNEARTAIFEYIEVFYNRQRVHSTLGYFSPNAFEERVA